MQTRLLSDIEAFLTETGMPAWSFGFSAVKSGTLVDRLRKGGRTWPETEARIRAFMITERQRRADKAGRAA